MMYETTQKLHDTIFKEYDIRGVVDRELFIAQGYHLGRAIGSFYRQNNPLIRSIVVGRDGRIHSYDLQEEIARGIRDTGITTFMLGVCPTPVVSYMVHTHSCEGGIMITASHNPKEFNGVKIYAGTNSLTGADIQEIKKIYYEQAFVPRDNCGDCHESTGVADYSHWLYNTFSYLKNADISCLIDCGNGTAGVVLEPVIERLGWKNVQLLYSNVDGTYPHHEADPTRDENMHDLRCALHCAPQAAFGLGLDGDADRMAVMTATGELLSGDITLGLFASDILTRYTNPSIVIDIKSSDALVQRLEQRGGKVIFSPAGYPHIKRTMKAHDAVCAGELSGHFFFKDRYWGYDDGIYAALRFIELYCNNNDIFLERYAIPARWTSYEFRLACTSEQRQKAHDAVAHYYAGKTDVICHTIDGLRVESAQGWGLVRPSYTQNVICIRCEGHTKEALIDLLDQFSDLISPYIDISEIIRYKKNKLSSK